MNAGRARRAYFDQAFEAECQCRHWPHRSEFVAVLSNGNYQLGTVGTTTAVITALRPNGFQRAIDCPFVVSWRVQGISVSKTAWHLARHRADVSHILVHDLGCTAVQKMVRASFQRSRR